jgi:hypothetical protein
MLTHQTTINQLQAQSITISKSNIVIKEVITIAITLSKVEAPSSDSPNAKQLLIRRESEEMK